MRIGLMIAFIGFFALSFVARAIGRLGWSLAFGAASLVAGGIAIWGTGGW